MDAWKLRAALVLVAVVLEHLGVVLVAVEVAAVCLVAAGAGAVVVIDGVVLGFVAVGGWGAGILMMVFLVVVKWAAVLQMNLMMLLLSVAVE